MQAQCAFPDMSTAITVVFGNGRAGIGRVIESRSIIPTTTKTTS